VQPSFSFDVKGEIDTSKLKDMLGPSTDVLTGYTEGMPHAAPTWNEDQLRILRRHAPEWIDKPTPDMPELAKKLTNGNSNTPTQPFLEEGLAMGKDDIEPMVRRFFSVKIEGKDTANPLKAIGTICVGSVKKFILSDFYKKVAPNSWLTIKVKSASQQGKTLNSDQPLVHTGQMMNATTYVIRKGGAA